ncbi:hypothetical protein VTK26DRAFT_8562 [Humicola hyalothermophila]
MWKPLYSQYAAMFGFKENWVRCTAYPDTTLNSCTGVHSLLDSKLLEQCMEVVSVAAGNIDSGSGHDIYK